MANQVTQGGQIKASEPISLQGTTHPIPVVHLAADTRSLPRPRPSYQPTGWALADNALDVVDTFTDGRADWFQRLFSYLFIGGLAALVNLFFFWLIYYQFLATTVPIHLLRYVIAFVIATEISILANFIPNDHITFSHLAGHSRSWWMRCWRFHVTCIGGTLLTLAIGGTAHLIGAPALAGQAIGLILATAFNFTFHHLFTYRHVEPAGH